MFLLKVTCGVLLFQTPTQQKRQTSEREMVRPKFPQPALCACEPP